MTHISHGPWLTMLIAHNIWEIFFVKMTKMCEVKKRRQTQKIRTFGRHWIQNVTRIHLKRKSTLSRMICIHKTQIPALLSHKHINTTDKYMSKPKAWPNYYIIHMQAHTLNGSKYCKRLTFHRMFVQLRRNIWYFCIRHLHTLTAQITHSCDFRKTHEPKSG